MTAIDDIIENFSLLDEWDDRYRYLIELGRTLAPLPENARTDLNKVQGCASQVWLATDVKPNGAGGPVLDFVGDSDAHIVRGLVAVLFALVQGKTPEEILHADAKACSPSWAWPSTSRRSAPTASSPWSSASAPTPAPPRLRPLEAGLVDSVANISRMRSFASIAKRRHLGGEP